MTRLITLFLPVAVSPGDQLLHPEKKKTNADPEGDQVDSAHADREHYLTDSENYRLGFFFKIKVHHVVF